MMVSRMKKILLIDDNRDVTSALHDALELNGVEVVAYNDPIEAVDDFKAGDYSLVLLDFQMPGMNGFQVYRELRKTDEKVRICFLTAFDVYEHEFSALFPEVKIQKFLKKPVELSTIVKMMNELTLEGSA
jgi:DNA-binding response OmpR family regulator